MLMRAVFRRDDATSSLEDIQWTPRTLMFHSDCGDLERHPRLLAPRGSAPSHLTSSLNEAAAGGAPVARASPAPATSLGASY